MPVFLPRQSNSTAAGPPPPAGGGPPPMTPEMLAALPHDNDGPKLNAVIWTLTAVSAVFLALRLYCKTARTKGLWWDDYVLTAAWVAIFAESIIVSVCVGMGFGKHSWDVPFDSYSHLFKIFSAAGTLSICSSVWSKSSFALTILRLTDGWMRKAVWAIIISINLFMIVTALINYIHCWPVEKTFDFAGTVEGTCWPMGVVVNYDIFSAVYSGLMDVTLAMIPWKLIWGLQMRRKEKIGVAIAMSMGVFAGAMAFVKAAYLYTMFGTDIYYIVDLNYWTNAECTVTIMAASIPVLRALMGDVTKSMSSKKSYVWGNVDSSFRLGSKQSASNTVVGSGSQSTIPGKEQGGGRPVQTNKYGVEFSEDNWKEGRYSSGPHSPR